jgi:superfamily I DNA/RNA helicase
MQECKYSDISVLSRNLINSKVVIKEALERNRIPYSFSQSGNLLTEPIILSVLSLFRLSVFHADADFLHFFHRGFLGYNDDDISVLRTLDAKSGFYDILNNLTNERFNKIKEFLLINQDQNFFNQAIEIFEKADFFNWLQTQGSPELNKEYIDAFIFWMSDVANEHPNWQLYDFLQYITEANNAKIKISTPDVAFEDSVTVATVHAVKGQDYARVIITGVDDRLTFVAPPISFDKDLGIGIKYYNLEKKEKRTLTQN